MYRAVNRFMLILETILDENCVVIRASVVYKYINYRKNFVQDPDLVL